MTRRTRLLTIVSWIAGAASLLPFTTDWFELSVQATNFLLLGTLATAFVLSLLIGWSPTLRTWLTRLAGPPEPPARVLVLVAVVAGTSAVAMLVCSAVIASV